MLYLLDTSVCVSLLRGRTTESRLPDIPECALSVITVAELEVGVLRSTRPAAQRKAVQALTELFDILPWDREATGHYGDIRVSLEKRGSVIGPLDLLIAAHARRLGATIVTANAREFQRVENLPCLEWK